MSFLDTKCLIVIATAFYLIEVSIAERTTQSLRHRVANLKAQIKHEIQAKSDKVYPMEEYSFSSFEDVEYVNEKALLTPIIVDKKKFKTLKTTEVVRTPTVTVKIAAKSSMSEKPANISSPVIQRSEKRDKIKIKIMTLRKPEIFYRRLIDDDSMNTELKWVHCQELISPFLKGLTKELRHQEHMTAKNPVVRRLVQLLSVNTTLYSKEDLFSILYQISNIQIRLFQWDVSAINLLFNILITERRHTFKNLKNGIRNHFADWRLDISNVTNLLQQSRIFRPPCVKISDTTGSTKSHKMSTYPKNTEPTTPDTPCEDYEDISECKYRRG